MSYAKRTDANQAEIVRVLRECGCSVDTHPARIGAGFPDLVCGVGGVTYLLEVKGPGGRLNALQKKWHSEWQGHAAVVRTPEDALRVVGLI